MWIFLLSRGQVWYPPPTLFFFLTDVEQKTGRVMTYSRFPAQEVRNQGLVNPFFILVLFSPERSASAPILIPKKCDKFCFFFLLALDIWKNLFMMRSGFIFCHQILMWWEIRLEKFSEEIIFMAIDLLNIWFPIELGNRRQDCILSSAWCQLTIPRNQNFLLLYIHLF